MGDNFRGFGEMLMNVAKFIAFMAVVLVGVGFFVVRWIDSEFGDGTGTPLILIGAGLVMALLIVVVVTFLNNMTHRSAGDDIVAIFAGMVDAMGQHNKNQAQLMKEEAKVRQIAMKDQADAQKTERGLSAFFAKRDAKNQDRERERERKRRAEEEELEAEWAWYDEQTVDGDVEIIE